jgi:creatinine amidohydrolase
MNYHWSENTSEEIQTKIAQGWQTAILPLGAIEQHGPHLAVSYDSAVAERIAADLAQRFSAWVLPCFKYGASSHHLGFAGTLSLSEPTVLSILTDLASSLKQSGITRLVLVNGHGGNYGLIDRFAESKDTHGLKVIHDGKEKYIFKVIEEQSSEFNAGVLGLHGGLFETALALFTHPGFVRTDRFNTGLMPGENGTWTSSEIQKILSLGLSAVTKNGVIGDPNGASATHGDKFYKSLLEKYVNLCLNSPNSSAS